MAVEQQVLLGLFVLMSTGALLYWFLTPSAIDLDAQTLVAIRARQARAAREPSTRAAGRTWRRAERAALSARRGAAQNGKFVEVSPADGLLRATADTITPAAKFRMMTISYKTVQHLRSMHESYVHARTHDHIQRDGHSHATRPAQV